MDRKQFLMVTAFHIKVSPQLLLDPAQPRRNTGSIVPKGSGDLRRLRQALQLLARENKNRVQFLPCTTQRTVQRPEIRPHTPHPLSTDFDEGGQPKARGERKRRLQQIGGRLAETLCPSRYANCKAMAHGS